MYVYQIDQRGDFSVSEMMEMLTKPNETVEFGLLLNKD